MVDVIYVYADPYNDMVNLTKEELQELLEKAFKQGYDKGYGEAHFRYDYPIITTTPAITYEKTAPYTNPYTITADGTITTTTTATNTADTITTIPYATQDNTRKDFWTYTESGVGSIIFTSSETEANYGIGTNMNN